MMPSRSVLSALTSLPSYASAYDAESTEAFRQAGGEAFHFTYKDGRTETMNYWTVPEEAMESSAEMLPWGRLALEAAVRGRKPKKKPSRVKS
ncbi:MAG: TfoX/Sxy family protein [Propionivibrio sp.]|nr:TfoX/Sxy family protein [Propionivibrio sp.]